MAPEGVSAADNLRQMKERGVANIPLGRVGQADDVAGVAAFLASPDSDYMTGMSITVAGGSFMD